MKFNLKMSAKLVVCVLAAASVLLSSCKKEEEAAFGILTMSLTMPNGQTVGCAVDQNAYTINNEADPIEPGLPASLLVMKINYTATLETDVTLNGQPVVNGETTADFSAPVTVKAVKGSKEHIYTITVVADANDKSETEGKRVNADMTKAGFPQAAWYDIVMFKGEFWAITSTYPEGTAEANPALYHVYKSVDGISWTRVETNIPVVGGYGSRLVVFKDKLFAFAGGHIYGTCEDGTPAEAMFGFPTISNYAIYYTSDGVNWESISKTMSEMPVSMRGHVDPKFVVVGDKLVNLGGLACSFGQFQPQNCVCVSEDGLNWVEDPDAKGAENYSDAVGTRGNSFAFEFGGKIFNVGGFKNYIAPTHPEWVFETVSSSADGGTTWTVGDQPAGFGAAWGMRVAVGNNGVMYMVGGESLDETDGRKTTNVVYRSTDGLTWTPLAGEMAMPESFEPRLRPVTVVDGDMLWIFGGRKVSTGNYAAPAPTDEVILDTWKKRIK